MKELTINRVFEKKISKLWNKKGIKSKSKGIKSKIKIKKLTKKK